MSTSFIRLNSFISKAGICSRRKADALILSGQISVDGCTIKDIGRQVACTAAVTYKNLKLQLQPFKYYLLNKPSGYVTTTQDPIGRRTVLDLLGQHGCKERVYPVGRLDYHTTGLLLLTNDGMLAQFLAHPSHGVKKRYHVKLDQPIHLNHLRAIQEGLFIEGDKISVDQLIRDKKHPYQLTITIHMGKNRIIRKIFAHLGYKVVNLDRIGYAHFTKDHIALGQWIELNKNEVNKLRRPNPT